MKILFFTLGNELVPSSRTRVFQYIPHMKGAGIWTKIIKHESSLDYILHARFHPRNVIELLLFFGLRGFVKGIDFFISWIAISRLIFHARNYNIVFIQKVLFPVLIQKLLFHINNNVVFDYDDAIYANKSYSLRRLNHLLSKVKLAVIENEDTKNYAEKLGVTTLKITGPIDCKRYRKGEREKDRKEIIIGWIGSTTTTEYLLLIEEPLRQISKKYPYVVIELIGASRITIKGVQLKHYNWSLEEEVNLLQRFDIGLMPIPDNLWSRGKGGYKLLQYMAMGIPSVCSPVGINAEIVIHGVTGFHARTDEEWFLFLEKLILDEKLRKAMGNAARLRAEREYSFETNTPKLINALKTIIMGEEKFE
jgi:glycosyltransferase involved in cell wall biosynthesis